MTANQKIEIPPEPIIITGAKKKGHADVKLFANP
jgi:hypothetical protein